MAKLDQSSAYAQLAYLLLPESMLFSYDVVNIELAELPKPDPLMTGWLKIYLEEKNTRSDEQKETLRPNGFTEGRWFDDFPIRDRKVSLNVRRRRYIDADGHNVLLNDDTLIAQSTSYSAEFGAFLKKEVYGHLPVTARTVGRSYGIEGDKLGRPYKEHLSDCRTWDQADHADEWMLLAENVGAKMSIDETQLHDDLFTILSNKDGHGGRVRWLPWPQTHRRRKCLKR